MKKLALTVAIILGLSMTTFADGGLFKRGDNAEHGTSGYNYFVNRPSDTDPAFPVLPVHGQATHQEAPVGSGLVLLAGLGAAYLVSKKRREE